MKTVPQGATALLIALNTPAPNGSVGLPVLLWGKPGVGKTSFIESLASEQWKILTIIASIHDPTDFSGLPLIHEGGVKYIPPFWIDELSQHENSILFLDELSTCPPAVQAALLRVVLEKRVGFTPLPEQTRIVAAANPPDLVAGGWELSPPMRNRFVHINWDISTDTFLSAQSLGWSSPKMFSIPKHIHNTKLPEWKDKVGAFLKITPEALHGDPSISKSAYASPRSWDYAIHLLASCEVLGLSPSLELISGCLGEGTAIALIEFLNDMKQPDPKSVLSGKVQLDIQSYDDGELYVLFNGMQRVLNQCIDQEIFLSHATIFLHLSKAVVSAGKTDVIFVTLQRLAKDGFLTQVLAKSKRVNPAQKETLRKNINTIFSDDGLVEFINVLS